MKKILSIVTFFIFVCAATFAQQNNKSDVTRGSIAPLDLTKMKVLPRTDKDVAPEKIQFAPMKTQNFGISSPADGTADVLGFMIYDQRFNTNGVISWNTDTPDNYKLVKDYRRVTNESYFIAAATYVGNEIIAYCCKFVTQGWYMPLAFGTIDPETGEFTKKADIAEGTTDIFCDMTYDAKTDRIFGIAQKTDNTTQLYELKNYTINT